MNKNTILTEIEEQELRDYFNVKVNPRYKPRTINKIIDNINKIRTGVIKLTDYVNPDTKILNWDTMIENWKLDKWVDIEKVVAV